MNNLFPTRRVVLEAIVLVLVAAAAGLSLNYSMVMDAFSGRSVAKATVQAPVENPVNFPQPVDYDELDALLESGAVLVDARDHELYLEAHLPGAISLPLGMVDASLDSFIQNVEFSRVLITYCNGFGCPDSFDLGVRLLDAGYSDVLVYEGGFPEWRDRGRALEAGGTR